MAVLRRLGVEKPVELKGDTLADALKGSGNLDTKKYYYSLTQGTDEEKLINPDTMKTMKLGPDASVYMFPKLVAGF